MIDCKRDSCDSYPWQATLEGILSNLHGELQVANNTNALYHQPKELTTEALLMLYVLLIFITLNVIGSSIGAIEFCLEFGKMITSLILKGKAGASNEKARADVKKKFSESSSSADVLKNYKKYLECFSIQSNGKKMLNTVSGEENLNFLHGIKTLTLLWVAINHIGMYYATILRTVTAEVQYVLEMPLTQFMINGIFTNDIFFVISGFLNGYMFFDFYKKRNGKIPWSLFYITRFLRFTPLYLIVLGFYATLFSYIDFGPVWPKYNTNPICSENWIWNVFYLNNFLTHKRQCMFITWYVACDLQLYVVSPIFLLLLMRRPKTGFALIVTCIFGSCLTSFMLTKHFQLIDGTSKLAFHSHNMAPFYSRFWEYFDMIYVKPYTRIGSYLVGILLGYFLFQRKSAEVKKSNLVTLSIGWTLALIFVYISFFAIYGREESISERALYNGTKHLFFACSTSWVIFVCITGQGGLINRFLSQKVFVLLSRLSYSFYFVHLIAIDKYFLSFNGLVDFSPVSQVLTYLYIVVWSVAVSFVVSLIFERPLLNLLGLFFREAKPKNKVQ